MIPFASQRGGGQDLATHLLNDYNNDMTEVVHMRGSIARDLHGAFKEWELQADALTRCRKYLYSLSINPDPEQGPLSREQYMDYIRRTEDALGLSAQPRAIVFHVKHGREHCHVVWSRIDADREKAVHLAYNHDKLMRVTREFARDNHLRLPSGYGKSRETGQISLYEQELSRQTGLARADHVEQVTQAWQQSDDARAFVQALASRGYILGTGKRPYVLVDLYGGMHALAKLIDDKRIRTADLRDFLGGEYPPESLPSVEEAQRLAADHRKLIERSTSRNLRADQRAQLKHAQEHRRQAVERERTALADRDRIMREAVRLRQSDERRHMRDARNERRNAVRAERQRNRPTGLAAFLGRVTGISHLQEKLHRYRDRQETRAYLERRRQLHERHQTEQKELQLRLSIQARGVERRSAALDRIEHRELAAFERDNQRASLQQETGGEGAHIPSVRQPGSKEVENAAPDVLAAFDRASQRHSEIPDLLSAFTRAAKDDMTRDTSGGGERRMDSVGHPEPLQPENPPPGRDRDR